MELHSYQYALGYRVYVYQSLRTSLKARTADVEYYPSSYQPGLIVILKRFGQGTGIPSCWLPEIMEVKPCADSQSVTDLI